MSRREDPPLPLLRTAEEVQRAGMTRQQVARRVRTGAWHRLTHGCWTDADVWEKADGRVRHRLLAHATQLAAGPGYALSHCSAGLEHGYPLPFGGSDVFLTCPPPGRTRYEPGRRLLVAGLDPQDVCTTGGRLVTSRARTVVDALRHHQDGDAVAIADHALRLRPDLELMPVLGRMHQWPLSQRARDLMDLVDGRRESPLESASAVVMHRGGVPRPELQTRFFDQGRLVARTDFWWPDFGVVGEADGVTKYGPGGRETVKLLLAQNARTEDLMRLGVRVVRWSWAELFRPDFCAWLTSELSRGTPSRVTGRVELARPVRVTGLRPG